MQDPAEFRRILSTVVADSYPSVRIAARAIGIAHTTLYDLISGMQRPSRNMMPRLAAAFPDVAVPLYESAGFELPANLAGDWVSRALEPFAADLEAKATQLGVEPGVVLREAVVAYLGGSQTDDNFAGTGSTQAARPAGVS